MKCIFYVLFLVNTVFCNDELNRYLNDDKFSKYQIIKDEKNNKIYIDLLYNEGKLLAFTKNNQDYKKTFNQKLKFCTNLQNVVGISVYIENENLIISCGTPDNNGGVNLNYYFNNKQELEKVIKYYLIDGIVKNKFELIIKTYRPTLKDFKYKNFNDDFLEKNEENFIKKEYDLVILENQSLYKEPNENTKTKMYLVKNDVVEILEEKENWIYILYISKDNKEIKAWIPKNALEFKGSQID